MAKAHLIAKGYTIVDENVRLRSGEIDLIARDGASLIFVEVRSRRGTALGSPLESVDYQKRARLIRAARWYLTQSGATDATYRFDVVGVWWKAPGEPPQITHVVDAFRL